MVNLALWLKENDFKLDQVQNFYPSPLANATTLYHTGLNSLRNITSKNLAKDSGKIVVPKGTIQRRLHKAILRYHDPHNWPIIREALTKMGLTKLIGSTPNCLVPRETRGEKEAQHYKKNGKGKNNGQGNKTSPGQQRTNDKNKSWQRSDKSKSTAPHKQGLTRFSDNQFSNRKPKKANGNSKHT